MQQNPRLFRKKPVQVFAIRYDGDREAIDTFMNVPEEVAINKANHAWYWRPETAEDELIVKTDSGNMIAHVGDWIVRGTAGEFYPVKADIFADIYEEEK